MLKFLVLFLWIFISSTAFSQLKDDVKLTIRIKSLIKNDDYLELNKILITLKEKGLSKNSNFYLIVNYKFKRALEKESTVESRQIASILSKNEFENIGDYNLQLEIFDNLSNYFRKNSQISEELYCYEKMILIGKSKSFFDILILKAYDNLNSYLIKTGDYEKALLAVNDCLSISTKVQNIDGILKSYQNKAYILNILNENDSVLKYINLAEEISKSTSDPNIIGSTLRTSGYFYQNINKPKLAIDAFQKAYVQFKKIKNHNMCSIQLLDIGYIYYENFENYKLSISYYLDALKLADQNILKLRLYDNIGACYWKMKDFENGLIYYQRGLNSVNEVNFSNTNPKSNPNPKSLKYLKLKQFYLTLSEDKAICWLDYYKATKTKSHLVHALETYELADKLVDYMRQEHTGTLSKYFWRNKTRSLYENAIETCFLLKDYEKTYYFFEKSRAVMLNDKLNELGAKQKLSEADQEKERDFQRKVIELNTKLEGESKEVEKTKLSTQLFDLQEQQERFVKSLETKYPAYYQLKYNTQIGSLKQIQQYLKTTFGKENSTLVSYFFGDSATYAMAISSNKVELKQLKYDVAQNQEFVNFLTNNQGTKAQHQQILAAGSTIYNQLIQSLHLPKVHLIISQDGVFMPFEALSTSATKAHYLLNDYAISYTYSGQFLLKNQHQTGFWPNKQFVGFAPVKFKNQLNTLHNSDIALKKVSGSYWFSDTFTGHTATKSNFLTQAKDHEIVQLFTHAFADSLDTEPQIYFADQSLKISDLSAEEQFQTQLLVLSACKTGLGKLAKGEGILSLARGFSMLGIPATITSLWSVEDKSTYQLTEFFYKYLNQGLSKDEALQKAKLEFLALSPNVSPSDWAGMILVGDSRPIHSSMMKYLVFATAFILLSVFFLAYYRFREKRS